MNSNFTLCNNSLSLNLSSVSQVIEEEKQIGSNLFDITDLEEFEKQLLRVDDLAGLTVSCMTHYRDWDLLEALLKNNDFDRGKIFINIAQSGIGLADKAQILNFIEELYIRNTEKQKEISELINILNIDVSFLEKITKGFGFASGIIDIDFCELVMNVISSDKTNCKQIAFSIVSKTWNNAEYFILNKINYEREFLFKEMCWDFSSETDLNKLQTLRLIFHKFLKRGRDLFPPCSPQDLASPRIAIQLENNEYLRIMKTADKKYIVLHPEFCYLGDKSVKIPFKVFSHLYPGHRLECMNLSHKIAKAPEFWDGSWDKHNYYKSELHPAIVRVIDSLIGNAEQNEWSILDICGGQGLLAKRILKVIGNYDPDQTITYRVYEKNVKQITKANDVFNEKMKKNKYLILKAFEMDVVEDPYFLDDEGQPLWNASQDFVIGSGALNRQVMPDRAAAQCVLHKVVKLMKPGGYGIFTGQSDSYLLTEDFHREKLKVFNMHLPLTFSFFYLVQKMEH